MNSELDKLYANRLSSSPSSTQPDDSTAEDIIFNIENRTIDGSGFQDIVVEHDNICRTIKFRIERYFEEVDRSTKSVSIRYSNPLGQSDESFGSNRTTETDYITFDWLIGNKATCVSGDLKFDVLFYDDTGYSWHTKSTILIVEKGLKVTTITPKPSQDWIDSWRLEAGRYLLDYQVLENRVSLVVDTVEASLPIINTSVEQCNSAVLSVKQMKQETATNADLASREAASALFEASRATTQADKAQEIADNMQPDILEVSLKLNLPIQGKSGIIYIVYGDSKENNGYYRWNGMSYDLISRAVDYASIEEAKLGIDNVKVMTPLTTASVVESLNDEVGELYSQVSPLDSKNTIVDNDTIVLSDSVDSSKKKNILWSAIKDVLSSIFSPITHDHNSQYCTKEEFTFQFSNVLTKDNTEAFEPTDIYHPSTKKYVDDQMGATGSGDMIKSVYDINDSGVVDNSEKVNGLTVQTAVPVGAKFTDTVYTHPSTHPASMITGLPSSLPANGGNADTVDGYHAEKLTPFLGTRDAAFINFNSRGYSYVCDISDGATIGLDAAWWHIFHLPHANSNGYDAQIALPLNNPGLPPRYRLAGGGTWTEWRKWNDCYNYYATIGVAASQNIGVAGILATDNPIVDVVLSGDAGTDLARLGAWGSVSRIVTYNGGITVICYEQAPSVAIPIQLKVVR